jgi:hypothetical protein
MTTKASAYEGTLVLEKLAETGQVDDFFDAVDSDDLDRAEALMKAAGVEPELIRLTLKKMREF